MKWPAIDTLTERTTAFIAGTHGKRGDDAAREMALAAMELAFNAQGATLNLAFDEYEDGAKGRTVEVKNNGDQFLGIILGRGIIAGGIPQKVAEEIILAAVWHDNHRLHGTLPPHIEALCVSKANRLDAHLDAIWEKVSP